ARRSPGARAPHRRSAAAGPGPVVRARRPRPPPLPARVVTRRIANARAYFRLGDESGQATLFLVGGLLAIVLGAIVLGAFAHALGERDRAQRAADLAALAGARAMRAAYARLFEPPLLDGRPNPRHLEKADYVALGRQAAEAVARATVVPWAEVASPAGAPLAPVRIRVATVRRLRIAGRPIVLRAEAEA